MTDHARLVQQIVERTRHSVESWVVAQINEDHPGLPLGYACALAADALREIAEPAQPGASWIKSVGVVSS